MYKSAIDLVSAAGAILGGIGACWAAFIARDIAKQAANLQKERDAEQRKEEQSRAKVGALQVCDEAISYLNQYTPEFTARVRSLKRQFRSTDGIKTTTDIDVLALELKEILNDYGQHLMKHRSFLSESPQIIVKDWRIEEIKTREILGETQSKISKCRFSLNEYEEDLNDKISCHSS